MQCTYWCQRSDDSQATGSKVACVQVFKYLLGESLFPEVSHLILGNNFLASMLSGLSHWFLGVSDWRVTAWLLGVSNLALGASDWGVIDKGSHSILWHWKYIWKLYLVRLSILPSLYVAWPLAACPGKVGQTLRDQIHFSHTNIWPQILAFTLTHVYLRWDKAYPNFDFSPIFALPIVYWASIVDQVHALT